jgi:translation initiation factor IF-3
MEHIDLGRKVIDKFIVDTQGEGQVEKSPSMEGRIMSFVIAPK